MEKTNAYIGIRVTDEFKARLEAQAQKERRSVSNLVLKVMEDYLEQQEKQA
ncbi:MAG: ribbon-helix-helix domain-containing protein [Oscillospiraceae bacterium]|nr:ribbon-helix-helix domain-containing protein [Oscillospiraceae bacterium]